MKLLLLHIAHSSVVPSLMQFASHQCFQAMLVRLVCHEDGPRRAEGSRDKPGTFDVNRCYLKKQILPRFQGRQVADIDRRGVRNPTPRPGTLSQYLEGAVGRAGPAGHGVHRPVGNHAVPCGDDGDSGAGRGRGTAVQASTVACSPCAPVAGSRGCDGTQLPALGRNRPGRSRSPGCSDTAPSRPRSPRASSRRGSARARA